MLADIERALPSLSRAERTVGSWILANPRRATTATVADIARETGISQPTVVRFCRSVGADGFRQLKLRLAQAVGPAASYVHRDVAPDDTTGVAVEKVMDSSIHALELVRRSAAGMPFDVAADRLRDARQIVFAGLGSSGEVGRDACQKFFRLGIPCRAATDAPTLLQSGAIARPDDAFVAISHNGRWQPLVTAMQAAATSGAAVIAVTCPDSPLAAAAGIVFPVPVTEDTSVYTPMSSRLAHLTILDALQVVLAVRLGAAAERDLFRSKKVLADYRPW